MDTNLLVDIERGGVDLDAIAEDDLAIAAVSVAEFRFGVELATSAQQAKSRSRVLGAILDVVRVLDYTEKTAVQHARLLAHTRRTGTPRGAHDLMIAAHAAETGRILVSRDLSARFGDLPGVLTALPG
jgi:tRNA(fMet)-specific endonuclease VapC